MRVKRPLNGRFVDVQADTSVKERMALWRPYTCFLDAQADTIAFYSHLMRNGAH
jgi:hypothetical protein